MRYTLCIILLLGSFTNIANAGDKKNPCRDKKKASEQTVAKVSDTDPSEKPPVQPIPDPVPQSVPSQIKYLADGLSDLPPDPQPGECYVRVKQAAKYEIVKEKVLVREETIRYETQPAKFKDVTQKILIRPETVRYEIIPEKFEMKKVDVEVAPPYEQLTATETEFEQEDARHEIVAERVYWKRGVAPINADANMTDDILCLVRELPQYKDYVKKLVKQEAQVETKKIKPQTKTIETQVLVQPAKVKEIKVPAEYATVMTRELVEPAKQTKVVVPAEYIEVERQVLLGQERMVWQRVLCDTNLTPDVVKQIQAKLKEAGFEPGQESGKLTPKTCDAMKAYQAKNKLSEGAVTYEFLEHIGVKP